MKVKERNTKYAEPASARTRRRRASVATLVAGVFFIGSVATGTTAHAAAFSYGVYAPNRINSQQIKGTANLSRDCSGTYGCSNYIKIERSRWYGAEYVNGWWANSHGWNSITATLPSGCFNYRTTVDSYNDVVGTSGFGVNVGRVGFTVNGTSINRYKRTWSSGWVRHCR